MEKTSKKIRRYDIDWLRVILFALLIWFHYAVFSLGILFESEGDIEDNQPLFFIVGVMHQWRLAALFVISGMGTAFAFKSRTWKVYIKERGIRLGVPLIFTIYILFFGIFEPIKKTILLFTIFPGADDMPYAHLWFVYNLLIYSIILTPLFSHVRKNPDGRIINLVKYILKIRYGLGLLLIPPLILALNGILFKPWEFGEVGMWWEFSRYLLYFLFGYLMIMSKDAYFSALDKIRLPITILTPIIIDFIKLMNTKYNDFTFVFHSTKEYADLIQSYLKDANLKNCEVISDNKIKNHVLQKSIFAVSKSGTVSIEICNAKIPSIILYKMGIINFLIVKMLVKTIFPINL